MYQNVFLRHVTNEHSENVKAIYDECGAELSNQKSFKYHMRAFYSIDEHAIKEWQCDQFCHKSHARQLLTPFSAGGQIRLPSGFFETIFK